MLSGNINDRNKTTNIQKYATAEDAAMIISDLSPKCHISQLHTSKGNAAAAGVRRSVCRHLAVTCSMNVVHEHERFLPLSHGQGKAFKIGDTTTADKIRVRMRVRAWGSGERGLGGGERSARWEWKGTG